MGCYGGRRSKVAHGRGSRFKEINERYKNDVLTGYQEGLNKYEIANKYHLTVGEVVRIGNMNLDLVKLAKSMYAKHVAEQESKQLQVADNELPTEVVPEPEVTEAETVSVEPSVEQPQTNIIMLDDIKFVGSEEVGKKPRKISDAEAAQILSDIRENVLSQADIAKMYGISQSTVSAIKCGRGRFKLVDMTQKPEEAEPSKDEDSASLGTIAEAAEVESVEEVKEKKQRLTKKQRKRLKMKAEAEANIVQVDDDLMAVPAVPQQTIVNATEADNAKQLQAAISEAEALLLSASLIDKRLPVMHYVTCGMIANRHELPVSTFIFDNVPGSLMGNFEAQYNIAVSRLKELTVMKEDGSRDYDGVFMYVTGLTSALASIIKACIDLQLNLTLLQYNPVDGNYHHQVMLSDFGHSENPCPPELESSYHCPIFTFDCTMYDFMQIRNGYEVIEFTVGTTSQKEVTIFINKEKALAFYDAKCKASSGASIVLNNIYIGPKNKLYIARTLKRIVNTHYCY